MPKLSIFTPCGALACSSAPSRIQQIYEANIANLNRDPGENFNTDPGSNIEATIYQRSRVQAMARYVLERAYNNANPLKATETLPLLEEEFGIIPGPNDTLHDRRAALAARYLLPGGAIYTNVTNALTRLIGSDFLAYRVTKANEVVNYPATGGAQPANFQKPTTPIKNYRLTQSVSFGLGAPQTVTCDPFDTTVPPLFPGDVVVVDPETLGLTESVLVEGITENGFFGTFNKAHSSGRIVTTQPFPYWVSTQRYVRVIVTRRAAEDRETKRKIHELMARVMRGVTTWDVIPDDGTGTATAEYMIEDAVLGRVGYAEIAAMAYP